MQVRALFIGGNQRSQWGAGQLHSGPHASGTKQLASYRLDEDRRMIINDNRANSSLDTPLVCSPEPGNDFAEPLEQAAARAGVALQMCSRISRPLPCWL